MNLLYILYTCLCTYVGLQILKSVVQNPGKSAETRSTSSGTGTGKSNSLPKSSSSRSGRSGSKKRTTDITGEDPNKLIHDYISIALHCPNDHAKE